ncbi:hypothetical protein ANO11243_079770 [Dothideomycetidae sp. 11243]|nr:hypothetical protein ANO11243_079770 [fungal sp. No.11243]
MAADTDADGVATKSSAVSDPILEPFLQPTFDPADYLNATLPSLSTSTTTTAPDRANISDLSQRTTALLTSLSSHTSRLSALLTQQTDDILRSSSRLAYEVELLSGETHGLSSVLSDSLPSSLSLFATTDDDEADHPVSRLRMLTHVRARLDAVVHVFGDAMAWPLAPSELSSALISVDAPAETEERGREAARRLRAEVGELLEGEGGTARAAERVEALRQLAGVWRGTAEEKVRARFLDGLAKLVEDEQRKFAKKAEGRRQGSVPPPQTADRRAVADNAVRPGGEASYGFINSLRKIRGDIYID